MCHVMHLWTLFVVFSARLVVGFGAFVMGGAFDTCRRSWNVVVFGWYPPFVQHSGPAFVGPLLVLVPGALIEDL